MLKLYKVVFFNTMILGTLISISSYSWLSMWMGLEINLLSIIPLFSSTKNMLTSESTLKYFITQAMASAMMLFAVIMMMMTTEFIAPTVNLTMMTLLNSALLTKTGAAPFHFWFPEVMEGLSWLNCSILLTWQKIAPMMLIMNNPLNPLFIFISISSSMIISGLMAMNQTSMRKILTFSSINHIGWMMATMLVSFSIWLIYFLVYTIITLAITSILMLTNSFQLKQMINIMNASKILKFSLFSNFLSLGGLPPFLGFLPKWLTVNWLVISNFKFLALVLILFTLIMLFIYMRTIFSMLILSINEPKISQPQISNFTLILSSIISLGSLISCTILFNYL